MKISVNYQKRKNTTLFNKFKTNPNLNFTDVQNYIPIYDRFFSLNNTNWNSINSNHKWSISDINTSCKNNKCSPNDNDNQHIFECIINNSENNKITKNQSVFIKMAPLLDPFKYIVGKYNYTDPKLFNLPSFDKSNNSHPKLEDPNNSSFVDGFFAYLSSKVLNEYNFIHGIDYYGSFLGIKNDYKINVIDDIDYLIHSDFFIKQQNILFKIDDYSHLIEHGETKPLQALKISSSLKSVESIKSIDNSMFDNIFETQTPIDKNDEYISLNHVKTMGLDLVDITNSDFDVNNLNKSKTLKSGSSCSSRTSYTNENIIENISEVENENLKNVNNDLGSKIIEYENRGDDDDELEEWEDESETSVEEEYLALTFPKFPVQVICIEKCESTLDDLIVNDKLTDEELLSALMQIIMILITYQKMFSFTHNDLHTNNIMYIHTKKKYLYYIVNKKTYKVPTFGKIYKIIDFGRAIYKFKGKIFCSDSFQPGGDAATQYNTEPYLNESKPRLDPNFSFDLCRLACSLFDYVVDDFEMLKDINNCSPLIKMIVDWCIDDNGINVLYKNNGTERYPDFKLYKMISRCVHKHTPLEQLKRPEFSKFAISDTNINKTDTILNIDELPSYS
jgi:hypothetical protein